MPLFRHQIDQCGQPSAYLIHLQTACTASYNLSYTWGHGRLDGCHAAWLTVMLTWYSRALGCVLLSGVDREGDGWAALFLVPYACNAARDLTADTRMLEGCLQLMIIYALCQAQSYAGHSAQATAECLRLPDPKATV